MLINFSLSLSSMEDQNLIPKGKRNKHQNLQMMISQNPNFSDQPDSELLGQCHSFFNFSSSPSSDRRLDDDDDNDDNDMAYCLMLLARGSPASQPSSSLGKFMGATQGQNGAGKAARCCVYECKTCNRTFPSFQALGGHRSSHKNPAVAAAVENAPITGTSPANEQFNNNISRPFDQLRLSRSEYHNKKFKLVNSNNKVHECAVCGARFMSGQALGGHVRRHRRGDDGGFEDSGEMERRRVKKQRSNLLCLDLDLNLPAPEDDKRDRSSVVGMAAPALLGCHY